MYVNTSNISCGVHELHFFRSTDSKQDLRFALQYLPRKGAAVLACIIPTQKEAKKLLKQAGFKKVHVFINANTGIKNTVYSANIAAIRQKIGF